jgi:uncharacterized protein
MLRDDITQALKIAMKGKDKIGTSTLRLIMAAIKDREIAARGKGDHDSEGLSDQEILSVMQTMVRQRHESIKMYEQGGRDDLVDQEKQEIAIIQGFLPKQMSAEKMTAAVAAVIAETGACGLKDMGRTMALLRERHAGQMDFGAASALLKERLNAG